MSKLNTLMMRTRDGTHFWRQVYPRFEPEQPAPVVLTVAEACAVLRVSRWTLYQLINSRQLATIKIGRRRFVTQAAITAFLNRLGDQEAV